MNDDPRGTISQIKEIAKKSRRWRSIGELFQFVVVLLIIGGIIGLIGVLQLLASKLP